MNEKRIYRMDVSSWSVERIVFLVAGIFVSLAALLAVYISSDFMWAACFFGGMLIFFAATGYCPMAMLVHRLKKGGK